MARSELLTADAARRHRLINDDFTRLVHGTQDWSAATPVSEWAARDVVAHLVEWLPGFMAGGCDVRLPDVPPPTEQPVAAWVLHRHAVQDVLDDRDLAATAFTNPHIGSMPLGQAIDRFYTSDVFLHTWDLARATGQDETLDPEMCAEMLAGMEPMEELIRRSGQYGPAVAVPADADVQTRLIGFIGRDPGWSAPMNRVTGSG
jgi:uncharacterized protein (TIGR03086 family)